MVFNLREVLSLIDNNRVDDDPSFTQTEEVVN